MGNFIKTLATLSIVSTLAFSSAYAAKTKAKPAVKTPTAPLTVWIMPNGASPQEKLEQRLKLYTQKTGIPTKVQVLDWGEAWNRISTALSTKKDAPDVLQLGTTWVAYFAARGEILPLNSHLSKIDSNRFVPVSWNTTRIDADTTIYSIPWFIDIRPVLGNKRILKKNGITPNDVDTYDGFVKALRKINASNDATEDGIKIRAYAFPGKSDWNIPHNFAPWIWSNGGDFLAKENGKWRSNILSEKTLHGIGKYLNFILDTLVSSDALQTNTAQIAQQFNAGELAFIVSTSEIVMQTRIDGSKGGLANATIGSDSVVVIPIPQGDAGSISFIGGSNLAIPSGNKRPEAIDLLMFLTKDENLDAYTKQIGFLPASKKVLEDWSNDEAYKVMVKALKTGRTYTTIPEWGDIEQILIAMFSAVWDQLEIPALYSEEKLYDIFAKHTAEIDKRLGYTTSNIMTFAEFQTIWHKALKRQEIANNDSITQQQSASTDESGSSATPWVFGIMVLLGFAFAFNKRRKK